MAVKLEVLSETPVRLTAHFTGTSAAMVNALRRSILAQLPSFAVEEVDVYENNSAMFNEYIAQRVGLIPLSFDEDAAPDAKIQFSLSAEGPGMVLSRDLKTQDEKVRVFDEEIPIMKLAEKQKLRLEATAVRGIAKTHAKFQSAFASYDQVVSIKGQKPTGKAPFTLSSVVAMDNPESIEIHHDQFLFHVESYNNVTAREHLMRAITFVKAQGKELEKAL